MEHLSSNDVLDTKKCNYPELEHFSPPSQLLPWSTIIPGLAHCSGLLTAFLTFTVGLLITYSQHSRQRDPFKTNHPPAKIPPVTSHFIEIKGQSPYKILQYRCHSPPHTSFFASRNMLRMHLPQGLCTCCSLCLEFSPP